MQKKRRTQYADESIVVVLRYFGLYHQAHFFKHRWIPRADALDMIYLCRDSAAKSKTGRPTITFR